MAVDITKFGDSLAANASSVEPTLAAGVEGRYRFPVGIDTDDVGAPIRTLMAAFAQLVQDTVGDHPPIADLNSPERPGLAKFTASASNRPSTGAGLVLTLQDSPSAPTQRYQLAFSGERLYHRTSASGSAFVATDSWHIVGDDDSDTVIAPTMDINTIDTSTLRRYAAGATGAPTATDSGFVTTYIGAGTRTQIAVTSAQKVYIRAKGSNTDFAAEPWLLVGPFENPAASETERGAAEIATQAETDAGADDERIVTPKKLKDNLGDGLRRDAATGKTEVFQHDAAIDISSAGLALNKASTSEAVSGADNVKVMTPLATRAAVRAAPAPTWASVTGKPAIPAIVSLNSTRTSLSSRNVSVTLSQSASNFDRILLRLDTQDSHNSVHMITTGTSASQSLILEAGNVGYASVSGTTLTLRTGGRANFFDEAIGIKFGSATAASAGITRENVEDWVGLMLQDTTGDIRATYDDAASKVTFDAKPFTITLTGDVTGSGTVTQLGNVDIATTSVRGGNVPAQAVNRDEVKAIVGEMVSGNLESGITVAYNTALKNLSFVVQTKFTDLTDVPSSYSGEAGNFLRANSDEDGLEFHSPAFTELAQTPAGGDANQFLRWNSTGSFLENTDIGISDLDDLPNTLGTAGQVAAVKSDRTGLEWVDQTGGSGGGGYVAPSAQQAFDAIKNRVVAGSNITVTSDDARDTITIAAQVAQAARTLLNLTDTPASYGSAGQGLRVNAAANGLEWVDLATGATFTALSDTPANYTGQAGNILRVNSSGNALEFVDQANAGRFGVTKLNTQGLALSAAPRSAHPTYAFYTGILIESDKLYMLEYKLRVSDEVTTANFFFLGTELLAKTATARSSGTWSTASVNQSYSLSSSTRNTDQTSIEYHNQYGQGLIYSIFLSRTSGNRLLLAAQAPDSIAFRSDASVNAIDIFSIVAPRVFTDLADTPSTLTAGKWLKVNAAGDALEYADEPTSGYVAPSAQQSFDAIKDRITAGSGVSLDKSDATDTIAISSTAVADLTSTASKNAIKAAVGEMVSGNTETGIEVSYEGSDRTLDFAVDATETDFTATSTKDTIKDIVGEMVSGNSERGVDADYSAGDHTLDFRSVVQRGTAFPTAPYNLMPFQLTQDGTSNGDRALQEDPNAGATEHAYMLRSQAEIDASSNTVEQVVSFSAEHAGSAPASTLNNRVFLQVKGVLGSAPDKLVFYKAGEARREYTISRTPYPSYNNYRLVTGLNFADLQEIDDPLFFNVIYVDGSQEYPTAVLAKGLYYYESSSHSWKPEDTPSFEQLDNTPDTLSGQGGKFVAVDAGGTAIVLVDNPGAGAVTDFTDAGVKNSVKGIVSEMVQGNTEDGINVTYQASDRTIDFAVQDRAFTDGTDTPANYVGQGGKNVSVKSDETGLEFSDPVRVNRLSEVELADGPGAGRSISSSSGDRRSAFTLFDPEGDDATFTIASGTNDHGVIDISITFRLNNRSNTAIGFNSGSTARNAVIEATIQGFVYASEIVSSSAYASDAANGVKLQGAAIIYEGSTVRAEIDAYLAKNASNQLGYWYNHDGQSGSRNYALATTVRADFRRTDGGLPPKFTDASDTPSALVASKYLQVNAGATALEFVDPPASGGAKSTDEEIQDVVGGMVAGSTRDVTTSRSALMNTNYVSNPSPALRNGEVARLGSQPNTDYVLSNVRRGNLVQLQYSIFGFGSGSSNIITVGNGNQHGRRQDLVGVEVGDTVTISGVSGNFRITSVNISTGRTAAFTINQRVTIPSGSRTVTVTKQARSTLVSFQARTSAGAYLTMGRNTQFQIVDEPKQTGIAVTYDDVRGKLDFAVSGGGGPKALYSSNSPTSVINQSNPITIPLTEDASNYDVLEVIVGIIPGIGGFTSGLSYTGKILTHQIPASSASNTSRMFLTGDKNINIRYNNNTRTELRIVGNTAIANNRVVRVIGHNYS